VPAERFGDYRVFERLGAGGMASVHRAERRLDGVRQRVALKRLLAGAAADAEHVRLFLHEAQLVSKLKHRNIAEIYDFGRVDDDYFLAMELVAGPTLEQLIRLSATTVGLIPFPIVLNLLGQICDALAYAHDLCDESGRPLGLIHRDVSPSNVVISSNGVAKLIDFGVAKTAGSHTQAGVIKGKLGYIAPEYLDGKLDRRVDLWAVGVIAHELLTNRRLFTRDDELDTLLAVRTLAIDPPSAQNPDVSPELDAIVMTALARDPAQRWQNATAMRNALLGAARPSSNAEVVEWVEWVCALPAAVVSVRPPSRSASGSARMPVEKPPLVEIAKPVADAPVAREPRPAPEIVEPTPIGAAMLARERSGRYLVPLVLILLAGVAAALVPLVWDALAGP
jgi:serine/threonine-protein kinase